MITTQRRGNFPPSFFVQTGCDITDMLHRDEEKERRETYEYSGEIK